MASESTEHKPVGLLAGLLTSKPFRPLRFLAVGAATFVINIGVLRLLESAGLGSVPAYAVALGVSVQFSFLISNLFVWADRSLSADLRAWLQRWLSYHGCIAAAVGLNLAVFVVVSGWLPDLAAVVVATSCATALKFVSLDRLAFRPASSQALPEGETV
jgi:putative flippase GtrA